MAQITGINALGSGFGSPSGTSSLMTTATAAAMVAPVGGLTFTSIEARVSHGLFASGPIIVGVARDGGTATSLYCVIAANTQACTGTFSLTLPEGSFVAISVDDGNTPLPGPAGGAGVGVDVTLRTS
jgi:hypothetical protein